MYFFSKEPSVFMKACKCYYSKAVLPPRGLWWA